MMNRILFSRVLAVAGLAMVAAVPATRADTVSATTVVTTAYTAVSPTRVLDGRIGLGVPGQLRVGVAG